MNIEKENIVGLDRQELEDHGHACHDEIKKIRKQIYKETVTCNSIRNTLQLEVLVGKQRGEALSVERERSTDLRLIIDAIATGLWEMGDDYTLNKLDHSTLLTVARYKLDKDSPGLLTDEARLALQDTANWGCAPEGADRCSCERTEGLEAENKKMSDELDGYCFAGEAHNDNAETFELLMADNKRLEARVEELEEAMSKLQKSNSRLSNELENVVDVLDQNTHEVTIRKLQHTLNAHRSNGDWNNA